ncbi:MAG: cytosine permease [Frankiaceae bacterium]
MSIVTDRPSPAGTPGGQAGTEAPHTLLQPAPRTLSLLDQLGLWGNLGVSLLGPVGAIYLLQPAGVAPLSLLAAFTALVLGTVLGSLLIGLAAIPGAQTGAPSMVLLRGLLGARLSYLPTLLNMLQLIGWTVFEIVVITSAAQQLLPWHGARWPYVLIAGLLTIAMALRPLGAVRVLRRYALVAVLLATVYLYAQLLRHPLPSATKGSWAGFWLAADVAIAVAVSWVPLASDYSRHSRSVRGAFLGGFAGYAVTQIAYYALGLIALSTVVRASADAGVLQHDMFAAFIAVPLGWLAFGVIILRELDQSFADTYSTVVSIQNLRPSLDRRLLAVGVGGLATLLALALNIDAYYNFLVLLGSVFVPMFAVFVVDYFLLRRHRQWDVSEQAPARWTMLVPWLLGFAAYQLINPGYIGWWVRVWGDLRDAMGWQPTSWMSASLISYTVAALATLALAPLQRRLSRAGR